MATHAHAMSSGKESVEHVASANPSLRSMQTVAKCHRTVQFARTSFRSANGVSPQWQPRRTVMGWLKSRATPTIREDTAPSEKETTVAKTKDNMENPTRPKKEHTEHKYSTTNFKISHRKLNMLGRQISGKPIDHAVLQMMFSEKRASKRIKSMLVLAREHALRYKGLNHSKLVVSEAWVTKGPSQPKRLEPRGRGHYGIRRHPNSKLHVVLREGKTAEEKEKELRKKQLKRIVSAGLVREDVPIRNPAPHWRW